MKWKFFLNVLICSIIAGTVMIVLEMLMVKFFTGHSIWETPRKMAAIVLGPKVLEPYTFDAPIIAFAMLVHYSLSTIYGLIFSFFTSRFGSKALIVAGLLFGLALYVINFYGFSQLLFPWFKASRDWIMIFAHLSFGFTIGVLLDDYTPKVRGIDEN